jgi:hypothetical protein
MAVLVTGDGVELSAVEVQAAGFEVGVGDVEQHAPGGIGVVMVGAVDLQHRAAACWCWCSF